MVAAHNLAARLAVEHCTHEARGLDVLPQTIHRFRWGDLVAVSGSVASSLPHPMLANGCCLPLAGQDLPHACGCI